MIERLMLALAAEMTPPPAYGTVHIIMIVVGLSLTVSLAFLCRHLDERKNRILLLSFAGVLIASEVFKQLFLYYVLGNHSFVWGEFPFQMCSMPMYLCPVAVLCKNERVQKAAYGFMMCFNLLGGFAGVFEPSGVLLNRVALTVHAVAWHYGLVFLGFYILFSGRAGRTLRDYFDVVKLFLGLCFVAFVINTLIGITVDATANMFFVGPNEAPIIVFNAIARKYGWAASTLIYLPVTSLAAGLIFWFGRLYANRKNAKSASAS
ncbi:MAG: hypothetical protein E7644_04955 [Ruminococcaceae bacterium]|nr:hypothetical protein [Oscillospiraceae bacterium]